MKLNNSDRDLNTEPIIIQLFCMKTALYFVANRTLTRIVMMIPIKNKTVV